jgi:uncharacterized membrane protein YkvA (DUF1232 family)
LLIVSPIVYIANKISFSSFIWLESQILIYAFPERRTKMVLKKPDEEFVKEGAEKITPEDIKTAAEQSEEFNKRFSARGPLKRFIEDGRLLSALIKDWRAGKYRGALYGTIAAAAFALLYVVNPFDLVPDVLPFIGAVDDAAVLGACLMLVERDLRQYRGWKENQLMIEAPKT